MSQEKNNIGTALAIANREIYRLLLDDFKILEATKEFLELYPQYSDIDLEILMLSLRIFTNMREEKKRIIDDGMY